eukprot:1183271-Prorocentrum_minimum.AAC.3
MSPDKHEHGFDVFRAVNTYTRVNQTGACGPLGEHGGLYKENRVWSVTTPLGVYWLYIGGKPWRSQAAFCGLGCAGGPSLNLHPLYSHGPVAVPTRRSSQKCGWAATSCRLLLASGTPVSAHPRPRPRPHPHRPTATDAPPVKAGTAGGRAPSGPHSEPYLVSPDDAHTGAQGFPRRSPQRSL